MHLSAAHCRAQAALQADRALGTRLPNVRAIAKQAAIAWETEAGWADKRERREETKLKIRALNFAFADNACSQEDPSENPDRALVSPLPRSNH